MMPDVAAPKIDPYPEAEAGADYFASTAHYQSVAGRILAALAGGGRFVLTTGSPPPNGRLLANALGKAAAGTHTVIGIPCGQGVTRDDWRRLVPTPSGEIEAQEFSAGALLVALGSPLPLYVLEEADQLSDEQLREFFATWLFGEPTIGVAVVAVTPAFLSRLERPSLSFLIEGLAARILFQHLGPDEIGPYLLEQSRGETAKNFTPDAIAAIAAASGGDPTLVNRLAFRSREPRKVSTAPLTPSMVTRPQAAPTEPETVAAGIDDDAAVPSAVLPQALESEIATEEKPARRPGKMRRRLVIGGIFVVGYVGVLLVLGTLIPRHFRLTDKPPAETETPLTAAAPTTSPPIASSAPSAVEAPALSTSADGGAASASAAGASVPAETPSPAATTAPAPAAAPARSERLTAPAIVASLPADEIAALLARGDQLLNTGDIISARLYYERAANAGDGHAALLMAETFDPAFLDHAGVRGVRGDASVAAVWYARARDLGERDAERGLEQLNQHK